MLVGRGGRQSSHFAAPATCSPGGRRPGAHYAAASDGVARASGQLNIACEQQYCAVEARSAGWHAAVAASSLWLLPEHLRT